MFGRKQRRHTIIDTLVGANTRVSGDLSFIGGCHVDGTVKGNVSADPESNSALSVSEDGNVEGGVTVPYLVLHGIVRGDVFATQRVELGPTARVIGNVYYNLIEMAIGAEINGNLVHQPAGQVPLLEQTARIDKSATAAQQS
jgi:cytoskeletal protein CcmA (bactofilin family)